MYYFCKSCSINAINLVLFLHLPKSRYNQTYFYFILITYRCVVSYTASNEYGTLFIRFTGVGSCNVNRELTRTQLYRLSAYQIGHPRAGRETNVAHANLMDRPLTYFFSQNHVFPQIISLCSNCSAST